MVRAEVITAVILAIMGIGLYFTRQDTRQTNIHLARIEDTLKEILGQMKNK